MLNGFTGISKVVADWFNPDKIDPIPTDPADVEDEEAEPQPAKKTRKKATKKSVINVDAGSSASTTLVKTRPKPRITGEGKSKGKGKAKGKGNSPNIVSEHASTTTDSVIAAPSSSSSSVHVEQVMPVASTVLPTGQQLTPTPANPLSSQTASVDHDDPSPQSLNDTVSPTTPREDNHGNTDMGDLFPENLFTPRGKDHASRSPLETSRQQHDPQLVDDAITRTSQLSIASQCIRAAPPGIDIEVDNISSSSQSIQGSPDPMPVPHEDISPLAYEYDASSGERD